MERNSWGGSNVLIWGGLGILQCTNVAATEISSERVSQIGND